MNTGTTAADNRKGFSIMEIVVVVAIAGVLSAIAVAAYSNILDSSRERVGAEVMETLNSGLKKFSQINYQITLAADDATSDDEFLVLRTLQWRDSNDPSPGSPFVKPNYNPVESSDDSDYRLRWNGKLFVIIPKGTAGTGLKLNFQGDDYGTDYDFPDGYTPL